MKDNELIRSLEAFLADGAAHDGDKIPGELELARKFNVSRSAVREALEYFTQLGVLERVRKKGTVRKKPDIEEMGRSLAFQLRMLRCGREEIKGARKMLECATAREVVETVTPVALDQLAAKNRELEAARHDGLRADRIDLEFHRLLLECCGNRLFLIFSQVLTLIFAVEFREKFHSEAAILRSVAAHDEMLRALRRRDLPAFRKLIAAHIAPL